MDAALIYTSQPIAADITKDGIPELIFVKQLYTYGGDQGFFIHTEKLGINALNYSGEQIPGWPVNIPEAADNSIFTDLVAGDLDNDGFSEVVVAPKILRDGVATYRIYVYNYAGVKISDFTLDTAELFVVTHLKIADLDNDGQQEIISFGSTF